MSDIVIFGLITVGLGFLTWFLVNKGIYSLIMSLTTVVFCEITLYLILEYFGVDNENIIPIPIIIIFSLITISVGFLTGFLYRKYENLGFVMVLFTASFCLMNLLLVFAYFCSNGEVSYQADYELVTYSVYIDGVKNETDKAVGVKLVDSKYSKYVDFDTGNIQDKLYISKYNDIEQIRVYQEFEYGISCKKDDIIVFSVLPGYDIISWDGIDPVKFTNRRAIFIQQDTKGEHNITINLKKL